MADDIHGGQFRATVRLSDGDDETLAEVGETCVRVPAASLPWLWAQGLIVWIGDTPSEPNEVTHG